MSRSPGWWSTACCITGPPDPCYHRKSMPMRVLLVSGRAEVEDLVLEAPTSVSFNLERRPAHMVDPEECGRDFQVVLIDAETTPEPVALGRALRAVNRAVEFMPLVSRDDER